jgi:hypothetical protein
VNKIYFWVEGGMSIPFSEKIRNYFGFFEVLYLALFKKNSSQSKG